MLKETSGRVFDSRPGESPMKIYVSIHANVKDEGIANVRKRDAFEI